MRITDILKEDMIVTGLKAGSKQEVLNALVDLIGSSDQVLDKERVREAIFEREKLMSTGVGDGFALPHGKTDAVSSIVAAFAVTDSPIDYDALDKQPVRLISFWSEKTRWWGPT
jgi:mannitol/fructose-specific phosphotransferase system IIA component (Ntr-type)